MMLTFVHTLMPFLAERVDSSSDRNSKHSFGSNFIRIVIIVSIVLIAVLGHCINCI